MIHKLKHYIKKQIFILTGAFVPTLALADTGQDMLSNVLSGLINVLTSTPARLMFVVAIIGVGYATLALGKVPKEKAIGIVVGIGIVFSASYLAKTMGLAV